MNRSLVRSAAFMHRSEILEPYDAFLELDGFDAICAFSELLGGSAVYVPSIRTIFGRCLKAEARKELESAKNISFFKLSRKYGFSERHLRRLLANG